MNETSEKAFFKGLKIADVLLAFSEMVESSGEWYGRVGNLKKTQPEVARALIYLVQAPATEEWGKMLLEKMTKELDAEQVGSYVKAMGKLGRPAGMENLGEISADDLLILQKRTKEFAKSVRKMFEEKK